MQLNKKKRKKKKKTIKSSANCAIIHPLHPAGYQILRGVIDQNKNQTPDKHTRSIVPLTHTQSGECDGAADPSRQSS